MFDTVTNLSMKRSFVKCTIPKIPYNGISILCIRRPNIRLPFLIASWICQYRRLF